MIHSALDFLVEEVNDYLKIQGRSENDHIFLTNVAGEVNSPSDGYGIKTSSLGLSLINVEEERIFKDQRSSYVNEEGGAIDMNPELKLNLYVLICANYQSDSSESRQYWEGLKQLSHVISFFQGKNVFTNENSPNLTIKDAQIQKLVVELFSYTFEQLYNFWSVLGAKYIPSVLYKVRLLTYQRLATLDQQRSIESINIRDLQRAESNN